MSEPDGQAREAVRIRRLPDVRTVLWHRARYEIEHIGADGRPHRASTTTPGRELGELIGSRHPADTSAWVDAADLGWDGGVGAWRSVSGTTDDEDEPVARTEPDPRLVARHARRIVDARRADSLASILPFLASTLERVGEPVLASEVSGIANDVLLATTGDEQEQVHRRARSLLGSSAVVDLQPTRGSRTEQEVCRLLLARAAAADR